ncbi:DNA recombination and repair protein recF [Vibrio ishigakensis]|uniref:DNA recombination and repair protein recF n=1 Tax=Vibrio ishigakensis TaxID=1481914 RepID=A0A0B8NJN1_9VIBR|nr:DNA recombination and repair protein recF [Vibrio ishigakensis]
MEQLIEVAQPLCQEFLPEFEAKMAFYQGWEKGADYAEVCKQFRARSATWLYFQWAE